MKSYLACLRLPVWQEPESTYRQKSVLRSRNTWQFAEPHRPKVPLNRSPTVLRLLRSERENEQ